MRWQDHVEHKPDVLGGKAVIKGTRIAIELILERLGDGWKEDDLLRSFPQLRREDIQAAQGYAAAALSKDELTFINEPAA